MAKAKDVSNQTVQKLWKANGIMPHITRTFKVSNDKQFEHKFWDVIGLYLNPPERALVRFVTRKASVRPWKGRNPGFRWASGMCAPRPTITSGTAR